MADDKEEQEQAPLDPEQLDEVAGGAIDSYLKLDTADSFIKGGP